jgi:magnesium-transporting ATPase (P-type)
VSSEKPKQTAKEWIAELRRNGHNVKLVEGDPSVTTIMFIG